MPALPNLKFTAEDEAVKQALAGIYRGGKIFLFKLDESGNHVKVNATEILRTLGATYDDIRLILATYPFPLLAYDSAQKRVKLAKEARQARPEHRELTDEEIEEEIANSRRYSLITCGPYHGAYNEQEATQILFKTRAEAISYINHQLHGYESFHIPYTNINHRRQALTVE